MSPRLAPRLRRQLVSGATRGMTRLRPLAPPPVWDLLLTARSVAGHGPVVGLPVADRVLVVAPHPDDETIGCGGTAAALAAAGAQVSVVIVSRGEASVAEPGLAAPAVGARRLAEATEAAACLGVDPPACLDLPDGALGAALEPLTEGLAAAVARLRPEVILAPWILDGHPDHQATARAVAAALAPAPAGVAPEVWGYEVWSALPPNRLVDVSAVWARKVEALGHHRCGRASFDLDAHLALARWRSLFAMDGIGHAEAFLALPAAAYVELAARTPC